MAEGPTATQAVHAGGSEPGGQRVGHIVPVSILAGVLIALLMLTLVTVTATWVDLGALNIWIAMAIATAKAVLVALYFMHLRYDRPFNAVVLIAALVFVTLFVGLALLDVLQYREDVEAFRAEHPDQIAPRLELERERLKRQP